MKNIKSFIAEAASKGWKFFANITDPSTNGVNLPNLDNKDIKWLLINTENQTISGVTEKDLKQWSEDFDGFEEGEKAVKALKIGDSYDADGGINIYIRIK